jgi:uncharacterized protein YeeX (DUF496 family)
MTMAEFNKKVARMSEDINTRVSLYIVKEIHASVQGGKKTIKIPNFFK